MSLNTRHAGGVSAKSNGLADQGWNVGAWSQGGPAILRAYDAIDVSKELYDSGLVDSGTRDNPGPAVKSVNAQGLPAFTFATACAIRFRPGELCGRSGHHARREEFHQFVFRLSPTPDSVRLDLLHP